MGRMRTHMAAKQELDIREISLVDLAYEILKQDRKEPISFKSMFREVSEQLRLNDEEIKNRIVQFYTDLNIDGRFICVGDNQWGLCEWYPFEKLEDDIITTSRPRSKKSKTQDDEDFDLLDEDIYDEDFADDEDEFIVSEYDEEVDINDSIAIEDDMDLDAVDDLDEGFILEDDDRALDEEDLTDGLTDERER